PRDVTRVGIEALAAVSGADVSLDATRGDVRDVVLAVVRGGCIAGTVSWPDGTPAAGFDVGVVGPDYRHQTGEAGAFRICGLRPGHYRLVVRAERGETVGTAWEEDLQPGAAPLALSLEEGRTFELSGMVVDTNDRPVSDFQVDTDQPIYGPDRARATGRPDG